MFVIKGISEVKVDKIFNEVFKLVFMGFIIVMEFYMWWLELVMIIIGLKELDKFM